MRCPKCSFISFDFQETCVKCGKNISAAAEELHGTVASMAPPAFLKFDFTEAEPEVEEAAAEGFEAEAEQEFDLGGEEEVAVDLGAEGEAAEEGGEDFAIEAEEEPEMDMADLAPAEEEAVAEDFEVSAEEEPATKEAAGQGLADLNVEGVDLETAPPAPEQGKVMPSVKTGTALDDFDIDLGDLLPKK